MEDGNDPESTNANMNTAYGTPLDDATNFDYTQSFDDDDNIWTVTATGNSNDSGLDGKAIAGCVNFDTGKVDIGSQLASSVSLRASQVEQTNPDRPIHRWLLRRDLHAQNLCQGHKSIGLSGRRKRTGHPPRSPE